MHFLSIYYEYQKYILQCAVKVKVVLLTKDITIYDRACVYMLVYYICTWKNSTYNFVTFNSSNFLKNQNPFNQDINECNVELRQYFEIYMLSFAPLYRICFVIFSLLALGTSGYFYCCCILYIFLKWPTLDLILTALRRSGMLK